MKVAAIQMRLSFEYLINFPHSLQTLKTFSNIIYLQQKN